MASGTKIEPFRTLRKRMSYLRLRRSACGIWERGSMRAASRPHSWAWPPQEYRKFLTVYGDTVYGDGALFFPAQK
jgi:hypothetical protein